MSPKTFSLDPTTRAVRAALCSDPVHGAVVPPLVASSTFTFAGLGDKRPYDYTRSGNPTRDQLGDAIAELEGGCGGVITSSGMSAITTALHLVPPGGRVVAPHDGYGGTWRLLDALHRRGAIEVDFVDLTDLERATRALRTPADLVWIETPSNPLLRITDIRAIVARKGAARVVVDNTFLSPVNQCPLALGADVVVHSTTKYLNGHSDVVGGAVVARDPEILETLGWWANCLGVTGSPHDAWLTMRGLRTLGVRVAQHEANAKAVAEFLDAHPAVATVYWPGLSEHSGHTVACTQQTGFGGMLSFELVGGFQAVEHFVPALHCFNLAESLGGVESLVAHPATMTHAAMSPEARRAAGIADGLLRLSVGIEHVDDLIADLTRGLDAIPAAAPLRPAAAPRVRLP
ncbi:MAG: cystathionine gamma-synthase [Myxococcota bacterium]